MVQLSALRNQKGSGDPLSPRTLQGKNTEKAAKIKSLSGIRYDYHEVDLGPFQKDFHRLMSDSVVQVHGLPGHGKTTYLLEFGCDLLSINDL